MMKNLILILLSSVCFNICFGQNELLFKKKPDRVINAHGLPILGMPQNRLSGDLTERVDSAWTRQFGGVGIGNVTSRKAYFTYTSDHLLAAESYLDFYLQSGEQYNGRQEEYFYNNQGQCTLHYTNEQDLDTGEWLRKEREEGVWSEEGVFEEYTRSTWDENLKQFENLFKSTWSLTSSQQIKEINLFSWDDDYWKNDGRHNYEYNNADSIQVINQFRWNEVPGEWELEYKIEYYYTNDTHLDSIIESWDMGVGLEPNNKLTKNINEQGQLESEIYYEWNAGRWEPNSMHDYEYTPEGKETLWTYFEWDQDEQRFVENYYEENTFTTAGDPKRFTAADYITDVEAWEPFWINEKFYDENVDGSTIAWPNPGFYAPISFHQKPVFDVLTVLFNNNQWGWGDSVLYFYGGIISATVPISEINVNVYPNPSSDQITIQMEALRPGATITFFDQQGKFVSSHPVHSNVPLSISGLIPGAYVYRIRNGTEFYSGKILKE